MMKTIFSLILLSVSFSALGAETGILNLSNNRVLIYESQIFKSTKSAPTFVFMPGIYRGQRPEDFFTKALNEKKINYVIFDFAEHAASVVETDPAKAPNFSGITSADLADEVDALVEHLQLKNAVPVALSYSSTLTNFLNPDKYPMVIEMAPIGKDMDSLPPAIVSLYEIWGNWIKLNPFAAAWLKSVKDAQLRQLWGQHVAGLSAVMPKLKDPIYSERAIQGYKALTYASEGFDLREQDFAKGPKRFFILAEKEETLRLEIQAEAIQIYQKQTGHKNNVFLIPNAGHVITADQPDALIQVLQEITSAHR